MPSADVSIPATGTITGYGLSKTPRNARHVASLTFLVLPLVLLSPVWAHTWLPRFQGSFHRASGLAGQLPEGKQKKGPSLEAQRSDAGARNRQGRATGLGGLAAAWMRREEEAGFVRGEREGGCI